MWQREEHINLLVLFYTWVFAMQFHQGYRMDSSASSQRDVTVLMLNVRLCRYRCEIFLHRDAASDVVQRQIFSVYFPVRVANCVDERRTSTFCRLRRRDKNEQITHTKWKKKKNRESTRTNENDEREHLVDYKQLIILLISMALLLLFQ